MRRVIRFYASRFCHFAYVTFRMLNGQLDFSLLTRRHDFVIVAFGASSARGDAFDQEISLAFILDLESVTQWRSSLNFAEVVRDLHYDELRHFTVLTGRSFLLRGCGHSKQYCERERVDNPYQLHKMILQESEVIDNPKSLPDNPVRCQPALFSAAEIARFDVIL
jgi:hypothetical protein